MRRFIVLVLVIALVMVFMVPVAFADRGGEANGQACLGMQRQSQALTDVLDTYGLGDLKSIGDFIGNHRTPPAPEWPAGQLAYEIKRYRDINCS